MGTAEKGKEQNFFWAAKLCEELKVTLAGKRKEGRGKKSQVNEQLCCYPGNNWETLTGYKEGIRRSY